MSNPVMVNGRSPVPVQAERMGQIEDRITRIDKQISTGERFTEPAEDPSGANRAAMLARLDARLESEQRSLDRATSRLGLAETAIANAAEAMVRARDLALTAANGTTSDADRAVIAREVEVLAAQLLDTANSRDESGRYLFAGGRNTAPAYAADNLQVVQWQGFGTAGGAESAGIDTAAVPRGPALFGNPEEGAFAQMKALTAALQLTGQAQRAPALAAVLQGLEVGHDRLLTGRAVVGAGLARLESELARVDASRLGTAEALAAVRGLDITAAFLELESLKLSLEAARASFTRVFDGTLFDRLG